MKSDTLVYLKLQFKKEIYLFNFRNSSKKTHTIFLNLFLTAIIKLPKSLLMVFRITPHSEFRD